MNHDGPPGESTGQEVRSREGARGEDRRREGAGGEDTCREGARREDRTREGAHRQDRVRAAERTHRAFLARVAEPGDEVFGRWIREAGAERAVRGLLDGGERPRGVTDGRWAGLRARAERADPERDLADARAAGIRFVCPGDLIFCGRTVCCPRECCD